MNGLFLRSGVVPAVLFFAIGFGSSAWPQQGPASSSSSSGTTVSGVTVRGEVVATAPAVVPLTTPYSEGTITRDVIQNVSPGPTLTVQTLLNRQPSILAYTDGPLGLRTNVFFRAFNASQFSETYDGIALNDVFNGGVTNQASVINNVLLIPSNLDSVEIFRGINNPSVNSYNSLGGTVNYLPRRPSDVFSAVAGGSYGSFNSKEFHLGVDTGDIHGFKQTFLFSHAESDGWVPNTPTRNTNAYYSASYDPDAKSRLSVVFVYNHNNGYTPFNMPVALLQQNGGYFQWPLDVTYEKDKDTNYLGILNYARDLAPNITFTSKLFGGANDYKRTSYSNPADQQSATQPYNLENTPSGYPFWLSYPNGPTYDPGAVFGSPQAGTDYHFYGYSAWGIGYTPTLTLSFPNNTITLGGNITYGALHSREYWYGQFDMPQTLGYNDAWDERDERLFASAYAQYDVALLDDALHITPGIKFIYAYTRDHDAIGFFYPLAGSVHDNESFVSPTVGFNYKPIQHMAVYGAFGQNIKFPDISAFYGAFQTDMNGNNVVVPVQVNPEHVNDYELGARYEQGGVSAMVNVYREDFTNTFVNQFNSSTGTTVVTNGGNSRYQGVELQLKADFGHHGWGDLSPYVNYAHNQAKFTSSFSSDYAGQVAAGQPLANVPTDLISAGGVFELEGFRFNADARYVGRQYIDQLVSGTPSSNTISPYVILDLGLSKTIPLHSLGSGKALKISVNADNLLNKYYFNEAYTDQDFSGAGFVRAVAGAPRSVIGSVEVAF